jgi:hypothetical protein
VNKYIWLLIQDLLDLLSVILETQKVILDVVRIIFPVDNAPNSLDILQVTCKLDEDFTAHEHSLVI